MKHLILSCVFVTTPLIACAELTGLYLCPKDSGIVSEEFVQTVSPNGVITYEETLRLEQLAEPVKWKYVADGKNFPYKHLSGEVSMAQATCVGTSLQVRIKSKFTGVADGGLRFAVLGDELTVMAGTLDGGKFEAIHQVTCRKK